MVRSKCRVCGAAEALPCGGCAAVAYCSVNHQKQDWLQQHKRECKVDARVPGALQSQADMEHILRYFDYKMYEKNNTNTVVWDQVKRTVRVSRAESCRWTISKEFMEEALNDTDVIFLFQHGVDRETGEFLESRTFADAFLLLKFLPDDNDRKRAYIYLVCSRTFYLNGPVKINLGLILHGFVIHYLVERGYSDAYLEASNDELIPYYMWLGYEIGGRECSYRRSIIELFQEFWSGPATKEQLGKYGGWNMRMCNIQKGKILGILESSVENSASELRRLVKTKKDVRELLDVA